MSSEISHNACRVSGGIEIAISLLDPRRFAAATIALGDKAVGARLTGQAWAETGSLSSRGVRDGRKRASGGDNPKHVFHVNP
jgi:hypothetical protein